MSNSIFGRFKKNKADFVEPTFQEPTPIWEDRNFWIEIMQRISYPVLSNLKKGELRKNMPYESLGSEMEKFSPFEAFSRVFNGIAPWLNLPMDRSNEGNLREKYVGLTLRSIENIVNPNSNDYLSFTEPKQSLVNAAFFAQGLLRCQHKIWLNLPLDVQARVAAELKNTRIIAPYENHWLLYTSMIEATLLDLTGECDFERLEYGLLKFWDEWYIGDGLYKDGNQFKAGYENSMIIHPMLNDILMVMRKYNVDGNEFLNKQLMRTSRLASQLERSISPTGTYPLIGEALTSRAGVFHSLSQATLLRILPSNIRPAQVRSALTQVLRTQFQDNHNFTEGNWLRIGINGSQINAAEKNMSTGGLYACCAVFLPLGLPQNDQFWVAPYEEWTTLKAWNGNQIQADQSIDF
ncbi:MAG: DUF2264 domain-containing protein [Methanobrevibacter sp.]|uniref:DUF2264 domain-containing protein n=1 Tax=Methanobrevibacter sp. TaxID=66852 RepID=UPI0026DFA2EC|nr:DUF2264 domain-containing protein [Methanobrevibacter sp.]MDO5848662.1 DUF2264 domain-containing protein [Methanobrevibacter sp.]